MYIIPRGINIYDSPILPYTKMSFAHWLGGVNVFPFLYLHMSSIVDNHSPLDIITIWFKPLDKEPSDKSDIRINAPIWEHPMGHLQNETHNDLSVATP